MALSGSLPQSSVAALCFCLGAVLLAIGRGIANGEGQIGIAVNAPIVRPNGTSVGEESATQFFNARMSDEQVHKRWAQRRAAQAPEGFGHLFAILGWVFIVPPISSLAQVLGGANRPSTSLLVYAFVTGAVLTIVEFTSEIGLATMSDWMAQWPILRAPMPSPEPGELTPAQSFEISYLLVTSRTIWLYAMDSLLLGLALCAASYLTYTAPASSVKKGHAHLGLLIAFLSLLDFFFEITRLVNWQASSNGAIVTTLLVDAILLPIWILWLGASLRKISLEGGVYTNHVSDSTPRSATKMSSTASPNDVELGAASSMPHDPMSD